MKKNAPTIVWFRLDLRTLDNPALWEASQNGSVIPVFIWSPNEEDITLGAASRWWLHHSLEKLGAKLRELGGKLILRSGKSLQNLKSLAKNTGARAVYWNRRYEPSIQKRDGEIENELKEIGLEVKVFKANLLAEPSEVENKSGLPFKVFTPFWRQCLKQLNTEKPLQPPKNFEKHELEPESCNLSDLNLKPNHSWAQGLEYEWNPGESNAHLNLKLFINEALKKYTEARNFPDCLGTSRLSPHLRFGEISPKQIWHAIKESGEENWKESQYLAEIGWREFGYHLLYHFPHTISESLRPAFNRFEWADNSDHLRAWQQGQTGYPLVDAGMRELWATGWMHNRVRMVVASFLVKHLLIDWRRGAEWFWDTLVDADLASNTQGWQWTAGCGADAAPYFRIFNPITQSKKFDPKGSYIHRWVPELRGLKPPYLFEPWNAVDIELSAAGIRLGENYPYPIVDHSKARIRALKAYEKIKK